MDCEHMIFRIMFSIAFIRSNIPMLSRDEIDILWDAKDQFLKHFKTENVFTTYYHVVVSGLYTLHEIYSLVIGWI